MQELLISHIVALMVMLAPPERPHFVPEAMETRDQAMVRYQEIAQALVDTVYDPANAPLYSGKYGRERTTSLLLTIAYFESGFRRDVDLGLGRARLSRSGWNDQGRSWCMMQLNLGKKTVDGVEDSADTTEEGWTGRELLADRRKCFTAGLGVLRKSLRACRHLPWDQQLAGYASGSCEKGAAASRTRMHKANILFERLRAGVTQDEKLAQQ